VVYEARVLETGETVAIKKVLQDRRFKNRELAIMSQLQHSNVIRLRHCFYSRDPKPGAGPCAPAGTSSAHDELHLNLVMEFVHTTLHRTLREHTKSARLMPLYLVRLYMWQLLRATHYIHSLGICHRDIKPQNVLLTRGHELRLCDFGSAKVLVRGEPNVSYICSRYYRAPELVWEATSYSTQIDAWSVGAVMGEMLLSAPLFPGESSVDQMISIIRVLGSPSPQEVRAMNPSPSSAAFQFPSIPRADFAALFKHRAPPDALELVQALLRYDPTQRVTPLQALQFRFFDPLPFRDTHVMDEVPPGAIAAYVAQQQAMAKAAAAAAAAAATTNNATAAVAANTHATTVNGRDAHPRAN
jgi:glycogen synthase kinase 3 beta